MTEFIFQPKEPNGTASVAFRRGLNVHVRLFAMHAMTELGGAVDRQFLLTSLRSDDYVVRQEASETLWKVAGQDVTDSLRAVAKNDTHEAVRDAAAQAVLRRELAGLTPPEKSETLKISLDRAERLTALWILRTLIEEGGEHGRKVAENVAGRPDHLGERARAYLLLADAKSH